MLRAAAPRASVRRFTSEAGKVRSAFTYPADPAAGKAFIDIENATIEHSKATAELWRKISIFIVAPIVAGVTVFVFKNEFAHWEHLAQHPWTGDEPQYEYQNVRVSKYFWGDGDKTLFWNDKFNHKKD